MNIIFSSHNISLSSRSMSYSSSILLCQSDHSHCKHLMMIDFTKIFQYQVKSKSNFVYWIRLKK